MAKPEFIARQSALPRGWFGHIVAHVMALDTARVNRRLLARLEPKPGESILELGCGHGRTLRRVAGCNAPGLAAGVDPSAVMLQVARRHLRRELASGRVRIDEGDAADIPHDGESFDKAFSIHTLYFWSDLGTGLRELRRVLRPGGELILGFHDAREPGLSDELPASVYTLRTAEQVAHACEAARFERIAAEADPETGVTFLHAQRPE